MASKSPNTLSVGTLVACLLWVSAAAGEDSSPVAAAGVIKNDPHKILGSDSCTKCHGQELNIWRPSGPTGVLPVVVGGSFGQQGGGGFF